MHQGKHGSTLGHEFFLLSLKARKVRALFVSLVRCPVANHSPDVIMTVCEVAESIGLTCLLVSCPRKKKKLLHIFSTREVKKTDTVYPGSEVFLLSHTVECHLTSEEDGGRRRTLPVAAFQTASLSHS